MARLGIHRAIAVKLATDARCCVLCKYLHNIICNQDRTNVHLDEGTCTSGNISMVRQLYSHTDCISYHRRQITWQD